MVAAVSMRLRERPRPQRLKALARILFFAVLIALLWFLVHVCATTLASVDFKFNPYSTLGIPEGTEDLKTIKKAYRRLSLIHHPEKCWCCDVPEAEAIACEREFIRTSQAYEVLAKPESEFAVNFSRWGHPDGSPLSRLCSCAAAFIRNAVGSVRLNLASLWCSQHSNLALCCFELLFLLALQARHRNGAKSVKASSDKEQLKIVAVRNEAESH
mmetsp:Transcript_72918/g.136201  ORF Transcript_72918/g.136201 Transcript_72918/m.136201 type:complete len:214 (-) Transcript_72918:152-793(-)